MTNENDDHKVDKKECQQKNKSERQRTKERDKDKSVR